MSETQESGGRRLLNATAVMASGTMVSRARWCSDADRLRAGQQRPRVDDSPLP